MGGDPGSAVGAQQVRLRQPGGIGVVREQEGPAADAVDQRLRHRGAHRRAPQAATQAPMRVDQRIAVAPQMRGRVGQRHQRAFQGRIALAVGVHSSQPGGELESRREQIAAETVPEYPGLSLDGKRAINVATVAAAESLYDRYSASNIANLARQSTLQRVYDSQYGSHDQCQQLIQAASRALADLERMQDDLQDIKIRTDRLRAGAVYRNGTDTVPVVECINPPPGNGKRSPTANVLLEEFWDVYKLLLR